MLSTVELHAQTAADTMIDVAGALVLWSRTDQ